MIPPPHEESTVRLCGTPSDQSQRNLKEAAGGFGSSSKTHAGSQIYQGEAWGRFDTGYTLRADYPAAGCPCGGCIV